MLGRINAGVFRHEADATIIVKGITEPKHQDQTVYESAFKFYRSVSTFNSEAPFIK